ncbi:TonB-dependent receptor [Aquamicrobium lusatiense]|uniref:TonB-dependent receptor n=1 Tax=Aquamicrobium lusatiense TaxID=89772 RepID=UPI00245800CD|nr:TonB-dependent receptor [Aquamicrobium lusatiense]MDH4989647.1 TonB-dependent receptor [Aquamicrobium lusatiense]
MAGTNPCLRHAKKHGRLASALFLLSVSQLGLVPGISAAYAQQKASDFNFAISAQPLSQGLVRFSSVTGIDVLFDGAVPAQTRTSGVSGRLPAANALNQLLDGTGFSWRFTGPNTVLLSRPQAAGPATSGVPADGALVLDTINIKGGAGGRTGTLGELADEDANYRNAGSSAFLNEERIQRFRGSSVGDFIKGTPGVLTGDNRNSGAVDVNVRGMQGFGRVPVIIDGTQQQNTVYRGYSGVASRNYVDPDLIGGAVIEKGPSANVYGVGATGGLVRMETLNADDIIRGDKNWGIRLRGGIMGNTSTPPAIGTPGGYPPLKKSRFITDCNWACTIDTIPETLLTGSPYGMDRPAFLEPTSGSGSAAFAARNDMFEVVAAYARRKNGNYHAGTHGTTPELIQTHDTVIRPGRGGRPDQITEYTVFGLDGLNRYRAGEEVLNTSQDNTSYMLKAKAELDGGHSFDISYMRYQSLFGEMMPSVIIRFDGATQAPLSEVTVNTYRAGYQWNPDDNDLINLKANVWGTDTDTHILTPYAFEFTSGVENFPQAYWDIAKRYGADVVNTSELSTAWGDVGFSVGGSYVYETIEPPPGSANVDTNNLLASRDGWRREASAFIAGEWKPSDWLKVDGALRYTWTHSYDNKTNSRFGLNNEEKNDGWAPMIGVTVEPWSGIQLYAKYAEAIRSPSLFESTSGFSFTPNPLASVKPEHARNTEIGVNVLREDVLMPGDKLRFKAGYFNNDVKDYLTRTNYPDVSVSNIDHALFRGMEASVGYDVGWGYVDVSGTLYDKLEFCAEEGPSLTVCRVSGVRNGYAQLHVPPRKSATLTAGLRLMEDALEIGGRVTYLGDRGKMGNNETGGYTTVINWKKYTLVDLFASYKINESLNLDVAVDNVTDVYYMDALTLGLMPSPGRTFRANLTATF